MMSTLALQPCTTCHVTPMLPGTNPPALHFKGMGLAGKAGAAEQVERKKSNKSVELPKPSTRKDSAKRRWGKRQERRERSSSVALEDTDKQRSGGESSKNWEERTGRRCRGRNNKRAEKRRERKKLQSSRRGKRGFSHCCCVAAYVLSHSLARWKFQIRVPPAT